MNRSVTSTSATKSLAPRAGSELGFETESLGSSCNNRPFVWFQQSGTLSSSPSTSAHNGWVSILLHANGKVDGGLGTRLNRE